MKAKLSIFAWGLIFVNENYLNRLEVWRARTSHVPTIKKVYTGTNVLHVKIIKKLRFSSLILGKKALFTFKSQNWMMVNFSLVHFQTPSDIAKFIFFYFFLNSKANIYQGAILKSRNILFAIFEFLHLPSP